MNEKDIILRVEGLKVYFYTASGVNKAVDGVSFTLKKGSTMGIVGESGSGKSVTSSSVMRLMQAKSQKIVDGSITFEDIDLLKLSQRELLKFRGDECCMIFQNPMTSLDPVFKIGYQMVEMIQEHQNISKKEAWNRAVEALKLVGIPEAEKRMEAYPHELSGGMCQRVIIAMAVCGDPKLIIADEPTTALDVTVQAQVLELLRGLQKKLDTAILLITHNLGVVWDMCDTVMVMYAGNTVEYADTKTLYKEPMHPYTWGLLDSMPKLSSTSKEELTTIPGTPPDLRLTGRCCNFYNRCPYVTDKCRESVPPLVEVEPGHFVACHRQNGAEHLVRGEVNRHGE
ncbi:MAG: ABC transporter ATP-binding protein [Hungatella sp.]|nr:ABC transporter ATP-binding protein [Hungatella sp.]